MFASTLFGNLKRLKQYLLKNLRLPSLFPQGNYYLRITTLFGVALRHLSFFSRTHLLHPRTFRLNQQPKVAECRNWRTCKHSGSGIAHAFANLLAVVGFIAVHRAFRADWLPRQKLAALQLLVRVNLQLATIQAETLLLPMLITAVQTYHERNGRLLGVQDSIFSHEGTILAHLPIYASNSRRCAF